MVIRECVSLSCICDKDLGHFETVLAGIVCEGGEIMVIMSPTKSMPLHSLYKDLSPSAMIASSVNLPNRTDVLIDTVQTLLR